MLDGGYAFISAYLKGEEAKTVAPGHLTGMGRAVRVQDILSAIGGTDIGAYLEGVPINTFDEVDRQLWTYFGGCVERLEWFSGIPEDIIRISRAYTAKYDVLNLKSFLQVTNSATNAIFVPVGTIYRKGQLDELQEATDVVAVMTVLNNCGLQDYAEVIREYDIEGGAKARRVTEVRLEELYQENLMTAAGKVKDGEVLTRVFGGSTDLKNLRIALRASIGGMSADAADYASSGGYMISRGMVAEMISVKPGEIAGKLEGTQYRTIVEEILTAYEREKNVSVIDEIIEKHGLTMMKDVLAPRVLSPLVAVWYLIIKEIEMRNVRLLCKAVFDNIPVDEVKEYLVTAS